MKELNCILSLRTNRPRDTVRHQKCVKSKSYASMVAVAAVNAATAEASAARFFLILLFF